MIDLSSPLDITSWKKKGQELFDAIIKEVKGLNDTLLFNIPLPSKILMTQAQYDDLHQLGRVENFYHTEDKMFQTPYNVMEVRVQNRTKATFKETMKMDEKEFGEWEKHNEGASDE